MPSKGGGNTPPDSELRNLAIPLPELRKPVANAIQEANQQFRRGGNDPWQFGPGTAQPWNWAQQGGFTAGTDAAGRVQGLLDPSAQFVSGVGGGQNVGNTPGQGTLNVLAGGGYEGQGPGQALLNRFGAGEFMGNTPGQGALNQFAQGGFVGNAPGQSTLNRIGAGEFARPGVPAYDELLARARGGSGGLDMIQGTAGGQYLQGNPHLDALINSQSRDITRNYGDAVAGIEGRVSGAGRLGSNAEMELQGRAQQNLGQELGDLETRTRYQDYGNERGYQQQAQLALPGAFQTEINTGLNAANARAGDEWQALQTMLSGSQAAGQGYRADQGLQLAGAQAAGNQYLQSAGQAMQGAGMAGDSVRADRGQVLDAASRAGGLYQNSVGQALQGAGMAPQQAAAQFMPADALMRYGGAQQNQDQNMAQENQDRFRYGQEQEWQNLQRYIQSLQGAGGISNSQSGGYGLQAQQGGGGQTADNIGAMASLVGAAAAFCDQRLKADIVRLGDLSTGAGFYRFRYLWDEPGTVRLGPMAQELAEVQPEAVVNVGGVLMVDMARLEV